MSRNPECTRCASTNSRFSSNVTLLSCSLRHFTAYSLLIEACNHEWKKYKCSQAAIISQKTARALYVDKIVDDTMKYLSTHPGKGVKSEVIRVYLSGATLESILCFWF